MQDGRKAPGFSLDSKVRTEATATSSDYTARPKVDNGQAIEALFQETEELLEKWKHPDPYHAPTAP
ncbi:hypothetical protein DH86_00004424, partial [Scytalidium sp. 3C]